MVLFKEQEMPLLVKQEGHDEYVVSTAEELISTSFLKPLMTRRRAGKCLTLILFTPMSSSKDPKMPAGVSLGSPVHEIQIRSVDFTVDFTWRKRRRENHLVLTWVRIMGNHKVDLHSSLFVVFVSEVTSSPDVSTTYSDVKFSSPSTQQHSESTYSTFWNKHPTRARTTF